MSPARYLVITPVRNEVRHLPKTIESMVSQTRRPEHWIVVNDGSEDGTAELIEAAAKQHSWIKAVHRPNRGFRKAGGGVIEAFYDGYAAAPGSSWDFLVKLDGDLSFDADYFEQCFKRFAADPRLGIGGGTIFSMVNGTPIEDSPGDPPFHVRGATKIYRRATWDAIAGLIRAPGWDTVDEVKANMLGWDTRSFRDLKLVQHKPTGMADGHWKNWVKNGRANYITGYHPAFMLLKCVRRLAARPYLVAGTGLFVGFASGYLKRVAQIQDPAVIKYLRQQQMNRLLGKHSLWS